MREDGAAGGCGPRRGRTNAAAVSRRSQSAAAAHGRGKGGCGGGGNSGGWLLAPDSTRGAQVSGGGGGSSSDGSGAHSVRVVRTIDTQRARTTAREAGSERSGQREQMNELVLCECACPQCVYAPVCVSVCLFVCHPTAAAVLLF